MDIRKEIKELARKKKALILAHNYQNEEIQEIADLSGDSLELSRAAAGTSAEIIVFCGVHFMAEAAKILSPQKKVLLPAADAGCPMADMIAVEDVLSLKKQYPQAAVVTYINSSAAVKALSDVICTSANAVKIVERVKGNSVIFLPDKNLGKYVQRFTNKKIIIAEGFCPTHERFTFEQLNSMKRRHPDALVMVHPECRPEVIDNADQVLSTGGMVHFVQTTDAKKIIVGTEKGMIYKLMTVAPHIEYISASPDFICANMKKINLEILLHSLINEESEINVEDTVRVQAQAALKAMLDLSY